MKYIIITFLILIILILLEMKRELSCFVKKEYTIRIKDLKKERKAVFLSDMHNHVYGKDNCELLDAIRKENPDYIWIGGDMLVGKSGVSYQTALAFVKKLPAICPVYYANGNHEQRMKEFQENYDLSYEDYKRELLEAGVFFLENNSVSFMWDEKKIKLTGLEIPLGCYLHWHKDDLKVEEIVERIGIKEDCYEIILAHNPSFVDRYMKRGADLILSGHLHGGIVRIPGIAGAISPSFDLFPKYSGDHYREDNTDIVVSKGLGTHTFNIRLFNPAELIVLNFKSNTCIMNDCDYKKRG